MEKEGGGSTYTHTEQGVEQKTSDLLKIIRNVFAKLLADLNGKAPIFLDTL